MHTNMFDKAALRMAQNIKRQAGGNMTHTAKHTPGPWGVDATGQVCKRATNGSWDLIAYLDESPYYHDKFANAALIAAAPAMYEALQAMLDGILYTRGAPMTEDRWRTLTTIARQAIAQAEGRQA